MIKSCAAALLMSSLVLAAETAWGDAASEAQLQYELGTELYKQARYAEAIERFIASQKLVPNANVVLNIVATFEYLKRDKDAYNWYETYLAMLSDNAARDAVENRRRELAAKVAVLDVNTTPPGADLFIDRVDLGIVGQSPRRIAVDSGSRQIIARLSGHREASVSVEAREHETRPVTLGLEPILGTLAVRTQPPGATVRLEPQGIELGKTPLEIPLPLGPARIVLTVPEFNTETRDVTITESERATLTIQMQRAASSAAVLTITGNVVGATVLLDGAPLGAAPISIQDAPRGSHQLTVQAEGHDSWATPLVLELGASTRVDYQLVGPKDRPWPGFRIIGYGLGGGLLVAGGVVGLTALSAKSDFDTNPTREGLDTVESRNTVADALMISGAAVLGATLIWDLLRNHPQSQGKVSMDR